MSFVGNASPNSSSKWDTSLDVCDCFRMPKKIILFAFECISIQGTRIDTKRGCLTSRQIREATCRGNESGWGVGGHQSSRANLEIGSHRGVAGLTRVDANSRDVDLIDFFEIVPAPGSLA